MNIKLQRVISQYLKLWTEARYEIVTKIGAGLTLLHLLQCVRQLQLMFEQDSQVQSTNHAHTY